MTVEEFQGLIKVVTDAIADKPIDDALATFLNETFSPESEAFKAIEKACHTGMKEGWLCENEHGGIKYGRPIKPTPDLQGCSVDVVRMKDVKGPHHTHPKGEIDMVMPIEGNAEFDGQPAGWKVYGPGTAHHPTVMGGEAFVLYLLPDGAIEFTR